MRLQLPTPPVIHHLQRKHGARELRSIMGAGKIFHPNLMLLFMNPTGRNVAAQPNWHGLRAPWLGTKDVWNMLYQLNVIRPQLYDRIGSATTKDWTPCLAEALYTAVAKASIYITNLSKSTQVDARPLPNQVFRNYLPYTLAEIAAIKPNKIVTFGNQVSSILLGRPVSVSNYTSRQYDQLMIDNELYSVFPTWYPVGQGRRNMPAAIKRLRSLITR